MPKSMLALVYHIQFVFSKKDCSIDPCTVKDKGSVFVKMFQCNCPIDVLCPKLNTKYEVKNMIITQKLAIDYAPKTRATK